MNKINIALLILFLLPMLSAAQVDMKSEFKQGETIMAEISGNFIEPLEETNIILYQEHNRIPLDVDLTKIDEKYYVYAQLLDKEEGDYSLKLTDIRYMIINQVIEEDLVQNFTITNETADFSVDPGFVVTETVFSIEIQNLLGHQITVNIKDNETTEDHPAENESSGFLDFLFGDQEDPVEEGRTLNIGAWNKETANFNITNITETTLKTIYISTENTQYEIPVNIIITEEIIQGPGERSFMFSPPSLELTMATNSETTRIVYLYNDGEETLEDINFIISDSIEPYIDLSTDFIGELEENESVQITIYFYSDEVEKVIEGDIRANSSDLYAYLGVLADFVPDYVPLPGEENQTVQDPATMPPAVLDTCEEMGGVVCSSGEECSEETQPARNGNCCLAECQEVVEGNPKAKMIGWTIIAALLIALYWFYKTKYKKKK